MAIPLYLTTIEQDIFDTFRYLPHAVAVGVGFVTVAAAWKNRQMIKETKTAGAVPCGSWHAASAVVSGRRLFCHADFDYTAFERTGFENRCGFEAV
ncbi:MAG: hypothetical protein ACLRIL_11365 [Fusicatenibacter saccharivorans]